MNPNPSQLHSHRDCYIHYRRRGEPLRPIRRLLHFFQALWSYFLPLPQTTLAGQKFLIKKNDSAGEEGEISGFLHHYDRD